MAFLQTACKFIFELTIFCWVDKMSRTHGFILQSDWYHQSKLAEVNNCWLLFRRLLPGSLLPTIFEERAWSQTLGNYTLVHEYPYRHAVITYPITKPSLINNGDPTDHSLSILCHAAATSYPLLCLAIYVKHYITPSGTHGYINAIFPPPYTLASSVDYTLKVGEKQLFGCAEGAQVKIEVRCSWFAGPTRSPYFTAPSLHVQSASQDSTELRMSRRRGAKFVNSLHCYQV